MRPLQRNLGALALLTVTAWLVIPPLLATILGALTDTPPGAPPHLTLETLTAAYTDPDLWRSLAWSLLYAAITSTLVITLGGTLAYIVARTDTRMRHLADTFTLAPILIPAVLFVTGWLLLLGPKGGLINLWAMSALGLEKPPFDLYSFPGMLWVGTLHELPLGFLWLWPPLRAANPDLEDAAAMAGATFRQVTTRITLPLLKPALVSGWVLTFIYALGSLAVPLLIGMPAGRILFAAELYLAVQRVPSDVNTASAYGLVLIAAAIAGLLAYRATTGGPARYTTITGKAFRPRIIALGPWRPLADATCILALLLVAILPLAVLVWNAFLPFPQPPSLAALHSLTLANFAAALHYAAALRALIDSLLLGAAAGLAATLFGALIAWTLLRSHAAPALLATIDQLAILPTALPGLVVGLSLLWLYLSLPLPIYGTPWILLIAYVTLHLPYAVRICAAGLMQLHPELEEAAQVHGASQASVFRRILFSLLLPSLLTSTLYVALRSFREYAASILLSGPGTEVFSVMVLDMWDGGSLNVLCAYVTMVTALLAVLVATTRWLMRRQGIGLL